MRQFLTIASIAILALGMIACGEGGLGGGKKDDFDIAPLQAAKNELDAKRKQLAELKDQLSEAGAEAAEDLKQQAETLEKEVDAASEALMSDAADFIYKIDEAFTDSENPKPDAYMQANHFISDEYIHVAQSYIDRQGNWRQAIRIYEEALSTDAEYQPLKDAMAHAQEMQHMTEERFAKAEVGMSEDEVIAAIGRVDSNLIRDYPEKKTRAWFYPRKDGGTAGVFFNEKDGAYTVYKVDFNAAEGDGGGDGE